MHGHDRLRNPVGDRRHAQHADPIAVRLGDLDRPDRGREVGPRAHPIPDLVEVAPRSASGCSRFCPSTPGAPLLALTCRHASQTISLGIANDFSYGPFHVFLRLLPGASAPVERNNYS